VYPYCLFCNLFENSEDSYIRVSEQGHLYLDNGKDISVKKAKEFWKWMYENMDKLEIYKII